jgi:hypothetical protein
MGGGNKGSVGNDYLVSRLDPKRNESKHKRHRATRSCYGIRNIHRLSELFLKQCSNLALANLLIPNALYDVFYLFFS